MFLAVTAEDMIPKIALLPGVPTYAMVHVPTSVLLPAMGLLLGQSVLVMCSVLWVTSVQESSEWFVGILPSSPTFQLHDILYI